MIFSAIAGWFVRQLWPKGVLIAVLIAAANAIFQFLRSDAVNLNRELIGLEAYPNGLGVVLGGFAIDSAINIAVFAIVWGLRRKFRPHPENSFNANDISDETSQSND